MKESIDRPSIIIACSEEPLRRVLAYSLRRLGCGVECVASHQALLSRTQRHHYAIILTCFPAPLLSESRMVGRLRGTTASSSLFVLTSSRSANEVVVLLERGAEQVLQLPISTNRLRRKIEHTLTKKLQQWG